MALQEQSATIKWYAGRRLYDTANARYLTLGNLAAMVEDGDDVVVTDARTGEDVTCAVLKEIIISGRMCDG